MAQPPIQPLVPLPADATLMPRIAVAARGRRRPRARSYGYYSYRPSEKKAKQKRDEEKIARVVSLLVVGFVRDYEFVFIDVINDLILTYLGDLVLFDSILLNNQDINRFIRLLAKSGKVGDLRRLRVESKYKLLYRASRDKWKHFHKHCDGYRNTLTVVATKSGHIWAGYISKAWHSANENEENTIAARHKGKVDDYRTTLFAIRSMFENEKYRLKDDIHSNYSCFYNLSECGPCFGHHLRIPLSKRAKVKCGWTEGSIAQRFFGGMKFEIRDYEVFQLSQGPRTADHTASSSSALK